MSKRRVDPRSGALLVLCGLTLVLEAASRAEEHAAAPTEEHAAELGRAAAAWLGSLDGGQRRAALYDFDDSERFDLRLAPLFLEGLRRDGMSDEQWSGLRRILDSALSE